MSANKWSELVSAIQRKDMKKFKVLLESRKIVRLPVLKSSYRLVKWALSQKQLVIAEQLVKKCASVDNYIESRSSKLLYDAVRMGQLNLVKRLVSKGSDVNVTGVNGTTPLHIAAKRGYLKIMEFLLQNGANVRSICTGRYEYGFTPLHFACRGKHMKCIRLLLKFNADVKCIIPGTIEPIHIAVTLRHRKMISLLLINGANVNARFRDEFYPMLGFRLHYRFEGENFTLLLCAISMGSIKISKLLLEYGADIRMKSNTMLITPLIEAIETNDPKMVKFILDHGGLSQINEYSNKGSSPLHHVITNADTLAFPYGDKQIYHVAEKLEIIKILVAAGANLNAVVQDCYGWTILEISIHFGYREITKYILNNPDFDSSRLSYETVEIARFNEFMLTDDIQNIDYINEWKEEFKAITYDLIFDILRREAIGLFGDKETIQKIYQQPNHIEITDAEHQAIVKNMKEQIDNVVYEMKSEEIGDSKFTFWNLLTTKSSHLVNFAFSESFQEICLEDYKDKYDVYYNMLEKRYNYALEKSDKLGNGIQFLEEVLKDYYLPYYCIEDIVKKFDDQQLKTLLNIF